MSSASTPDLPQAVATPPHDGTAAGTSGRALLVHYTYTQQALAMSDAMAEELRGDGVDVTQAAIAFTDRRYVDRFKRFPMNNAFVDVLRMLPAQLLRKTGEI